MAISLIICVASLFFLLPLLRRDGISLGIPIGYMGLLLLIHVPGAYAHLVTDGVLFFTEYVEIGIYYTAIASVCFVAGVWTAGYSIGREPVGAELDRRKFALFCLIGGWCFTFGLSFLRNVPSLGAAVDKAGAIWMLGVILGLRNAMKRGDLISAGLWCAAMMVYPIIMLVIGGFLSYGSAAIVIIVAVLAISIESRTKVILGIVVSAFIGLNVFVNYFQHRSEIRDAAWRGGSLQDRIDANWDTIRDFEWFSTDNALQLHALDQRLNQNYFVGLAATRIDVGSVDYLYGRSVWEGLISLVPRALWPEKPVLAGSPKIVAEMTGLQLPENTSWGVGNVMEFQINFGTPGVVIGFFLFGFILRRLDRGAAAAERRGDYGKAILCFLPAIAMIQPNGSLVEICSGATAALVGAIGWRWLWMRWARRQSRAADKLRGYSPHSIERR